MAKKKDDALHVLKTSANKVWLAGLGALAQAGKQGDKLFKTLVKKGKKYEDLISTAGDVKDTVDAAKKQATETYTSMEAAFDRQVANALKRAGVAQQAEVDALKKEVAKLKREAKGNPAKAKKAATKKKKTAAKKKTTSKKKATARPRKKKP
jgi:poly(hydroxyalkanoate) granule-associated protein